MQHVRDKAAPGALLERTFAEVLERQTFLFSERVEPGDLPAADGPLVEITVDYSGPATGALRLALPAALGALIAANMLGVEPDSREVQAGWQDAAKELANVLCGHVLTARDGPTAIYKLAAPQIEAIDAARWSAACGDAGAVACCVEELPAVVRLM